MGNPIDEPSYPSYRDLFHIGIVLPPRPIQSQVTEPEFEDLPDLEYIIPADNSSSSGVALSASSNENGFCGPRSFSFTEGLPRQE
jgi:hypothetical protein